MNATPGQTSVATVQAGSTIGFKGTSHFTSRMLARIHTASELTIVLAAVSHYG